MTRSCERNVSEFMAVQFKQRRSFCRLKQMFITPDWARVGDAEEHERDPGERNHTKEQRATEREISTARPSAHPLETHVAFLNNGSVALRNVPRDKKRDDSSERLTRSQKCAA